MKTPEQIVLVIHGPNLNLLGNREAGYYGTLTLDELNSMIEEHTRLRNMKVKFLQSNHEGEIVEGIQSAPNDVDGILLNAAGFTHSSVAIRDAIIHVGLPVVEIHLSNIYARESFRKKSLIAPVCQGQIAGFKEFSYLLGIDALRFILDKQEE